MRHALPKSSASMPHSAWAACSRYDLSAGDCEIEADTEDLQLEKVVERAPPTPPSPLHPCVLRRRLQRLLPQLTRR